MSTLQMLADLIVYAGGGTQGTDVFAGRMPTSPDDCVSVSVYQGLPPDYVQESAAPASERVSFQTLIRGTSREAVETKAQTIWRGVASVRNQYINAAFLLAVRPMQSPFELMQDSNDRVVYVFNAEAMVRR